MGDDGPKEAGVQHINKHGKEHFEGVLRCAWTEAKGRILLATRNYAPGEVILTESPLHIVQEDEKSAGFRRLKKICKDYEDDFDYEPLWYWCAVQSLTAEQLQGAKVEGCTGASEETQFNLKLLHHEKVREPSAAARILVREMVPRADPVLLERLIQIWVLNCFEYSDNPQGYSTYFFSSFMSHSCWPNAVWHYDGTDHVLRCRREIKIGHEVCISYLPESGLLQSAPARRMELHETKQFWCDCLRCAPGVDDNSRGLKCPNCEEGCVFAFTPAAGPAESGAALLASHLVDAKCPNCGWTVTEEESQKLAALEKKLQDLLDRYGRSEVQTLKRLQQDESFVDQYFSQHVLADLAWEQFGSHYASKSRVDDTRRLLKHRVEFHQAAYPGLSGAHAWSLEALGDCASKGAGKGPSEKDLEAAMRSYSEALEILRPMFGNEHEYVTEVEGKLSALK